MTPREVEITLRVTTDAPLPFLRNLHDEAVQLFVGAPYTTYLMDAKVRVVESWEEEAHG
jgi:hypothetical protein